MYYAFPVLSGAISADTGWPAPALAAAFSAGLVVSALLGIVVGRWLDRHGPAVADDRSARCWRPSPWSARAGRRRCGWFVAAWLLAGVAMSAVLYPPAFAALTRWYGPRRVGALTVLTLAGGLASTIFAPITAVLAGPLGWRGTYLVLAAVLAADHRPRASARPEASRGRRPPHVTQERHRPDRVLRSRAFLALVAAFALAACASYAVVVNLVPAARPNGA